ncbi:hypothetical protein ACOYW6_12820 [Parablastomonas sp. CN1-191]|uniref:hypothetical protein n=1 Tax=Parablastomonas sp. CN1-191 TaxID=3400908 RepID=UPI003BF928E4
MLVEVLDGEVLLFEADFHFLPRVGETISKDSGGYFTYYDVEEVWHRQEASGAFKACVGVVLND